MRGALAAGLGSAAVAIVPRHGRLTAPLTLLSGFVVGTAIELPVTTPAGAALLGAALTMRRARSAAARDLAGVAVGIAAAAATVRLWPVAPKSPARSRLLPRSHAAGVGPDGGGLSIIVNPAAGSSLSRDATPALRDLLPSADVVEVEDGDLMSALEARAAEGQAVGIVGGDGSINAAAEVAIESSTPLVVVPGGTLNHLARDLGLWSPADAAAAVRAQSLTAIDVGMIAGRPFLNTASFGSYAELVDTRERLEQRIGKWPAVAVALIRVLRRAQPVEVELDGRRRSIWMIFIGNCQYHPSGFAPSWRDALDDGLLDVRVVDAAHPWSRSRLVAAVLTGTLGRCRLYEQRLVKELAVRSLEGPLRLARDGETFDGPTEFTVGKSPERLAVFAGARSGG